MREPETGKQTCVGSGKPVRLETTVFSGRDWTGECSVCGQRLQLGYAGIAPDHEVPSPPP